MINAFHFFFSSFSFHFVVSVYIYFLLPHSISFYRSFLRFSIRCLELKALIQRGNNCFTNMMMDIMKVQETWRFTQFTWKRAKKPDTHFIYLFNVYVGRNIARIRRLRMKIETKREWELNYNSAQWCGTSSVCLNVWFTVCIWLLLIYKLHNINFEKTPILWFQIYSHFPSMDLCMKLLLPSISECKVQTYLVSYRIHSVRINRKLIRLNLISRMDWYRACSVRCCVGRVEVVKVAKAKIIQPFTYNIDELSK